MHEDIRAILQTFEDDFSPDKGSAIQKLMDIEAETVINLLPFVSYYKNQDNYRPDIVALLVEALKKHENSVTENLIEILDRGSFFMVQAAAYVLGQFKKLKNFDALVDSLEHQKDYYLMRAIAEAIGKLGETAITQILDKFPTFTDISIQLAIIEGISTAQTESVTSFLVNLLKNQDTKLRMTAADALGTHHATAIRLLETRANKQLVQPLLNLLADKDNTVRFYAVQSLAILNSPASYDAFLELAKDEDDKIKEAAIRYLKDAKFRNKLGGAEMLPELYTIPGFEPGKLSIMGRPRSGDWLEDEIKALGFTGVAFVVSLLTEAEVHELGLEREAELCALAGLQFFNLPIPDRGLPPSMIALQELVAKILELVEAGKHVVIHCRMGIGRSAMVAAILLKNRGYTAQQAFELISQIRGCEVPDTAEQSDWVKAYNL